MLTEADQYGHTMPQLEWLYFGQIPMGLLLGTDNKVKMAVALDTERNDGVTFPHKMFGVCKG